MDELVQGRGSYGDEDWPDEAERMYERVEVLGKGSFGVVWMARRVVAPQDELDDEYVALKNIEIRELKGRVYAEREISILSELRHPNVIRLVRAFPVFRNTSRLVALQLARGPNLQYLVSKRGALGLPLIRSVARELIAAVSYLHGRAVIHRDIKPTNCILENTELAPQDFYDWIGDDNIWSDSANAQQSVESGKYKVMLVDFGFARALEEHEITGQKAPMRGSILNETMGIAEVARLVAEQYGDEDVENATTALTRNSIAEDGALDAEKLTAHRKKRYSVSRPVSLIMEEFGEDLEGEEDANDDDPEPSEDDEEQDSKEQTPESADEKKEVDLPMQTRQNFSSNPVRSRHASHRKSTTRTQVRSMSALGTKAYAAPEIKHQLRNKTQDDVEQSKEALTECVADYGMIVDAYSVGWTLRVVTTGIPPNATMSQYMKKLEAIQENYEPVEVGCLCCKKTLPPPEPIKVRDVTEIPKDAALFISLLTKPNPDERITVREAQNHPYIQGGDNESRFLLPQGDYPSRHGDPVVFLKCAGRSYSAMVPASDEILEDF